MSVDKDDRVYVFQGKYRTLHGKVIERNVGILQITCKVKLDSSDNLVSIKESYLDSEKLEPHEVATEVKNLVSYIPEVPEIPPDKKKELPTHFQMFEKDLNAGNWSEALNEYNYIESYLKKPCEGIEDKRVSLEKLAWAVKNVNKNTLI
ncbi:MAG: hypothetical protein QNJ49_11425 [Mastigocoleus sp. MO_167.B18]|nr:hypothetical protein [Mastigocoleus sp. MO_167.B18]